VKRPGTGISPADLERVIGRTVARALSEDEVIEWTALSDR
jgi:sialic acid synthase SpsE